MSKKLDGKVAIVTGASKGIGAAIAVDLASEGAAVVVNYASSKAGADKVVDQIKKNGGKAIAVQADLSKPAEIGKLFSATKKEFDKLDILVNNAGVYEFQPLENITPEQFHRMYDLNVLGLLLATQEAAKMFGSVGGSVVNISSVAAAAAPPTASVYSGTKAAVVAITRSFGTRTRPKKDSRQLRQSRHGRNRRCSHDRHRWQRLRKRLHRPIAARPHRPTQRHRPDGHLPRLR